MLSYSFYASWRRCVSLLRSWSQGRHITCLDVNCFLRRKTFKLLPKELNFWIQFSWCQVLFNDFFSPQDKSYSSFSSLKSYPDRTWFQWGSEKIFYCDTGITVFYSDMQTNLSQRAETVCFKISLKVQLISHWHFPWGWFCNTVSSHHVSMI